jgi:hypothetical protein
MKPLYTLFCIILLASQAICQHQESENHENNTENKITEHDQGDHESFKRFRLAAIMAYSWVPKGDTHSGEIIGVVVAPTIGVDLEYFLKERWAIGLYADVEIMVYEVDRGEGDTITREYPVVVAFGTTYEFVRNWNLFGAVGYEFENHESFWIGELGIEREIRIPNNWDICPHFTYTIKHGYDSWKLGVAFGKRF